MSKSLQAKWNFSTAIKQYENSTVELKKKEEKLENCSQTKEKKEQQHNFFLFSHFYEKYKFIL